MVNSKSSGLEVLFRIFSTTLELLVKFTRALRNQINHASFSAFTYVLVTLDGSKIGRVYAVAREGYSFLNQISTVRAIDVELKTGKILPLFHPSI